MQDSVAKGFKQVDGIDYFDNFSPVPCFALIRLFLVMLVVLKGWIHRHIKIKCTYIFGNRNQIIYAEQPKGFEIKEKEGYVLKLNKSLYDLNQTYTGCIKNCNWVYINTDLAILVDVDVSQYLLNVRNH